MLIFITGPTGVGKTDASWALIDLGAPMVFLDCDWFASRRPFSWKSESDVASVWQALVTMVRQHISQGRRRFVIPLTVELALSFEMHQGKFAEFDLPSFTLQLKCDEPTLRNRILGRDREEAQKAEELGIVCEHQQIFATLTSRFPVIDTSHSDDHAVAKEIWRVVNGHLQIED